MGDFGIFNGKNDLAKFLSIFGAFFIVFSILYPVEKNKELELLIVRNNNQIRILEDLAKKTDEKLTFLMNRTNEINSQLKSSFGSKKESLYKERESIGVTADLLVEKLSKKNIEITNFKEEISVNKKYSKSYESYLLTLTILGWIMLALGLIGWFMSAYKDWKKT